MFRFEHNNSFSALVCVHVGDISPSGNMDGERALEQVLSHFPNSGLDELSASTPLAYLGLDLTMVGKDVRLSQQTCAKDKLRETDINDVCVGGEFKISAQRRTTVTNQIIGALIWVTQTRIDLNFSIARLASSAAETIQGPPPSSQNGFPKQIESFENVRLVIFLELQITSPVDSQVR